MYTQDFRQVCIHVQRKIQSWEQHLGFLSLFFKFLYCCLNYCVSSVRFSQRFKLENVQFERINIWFLHFSKSKDQKILRWNILSNQFYVLLAIYFWHRDVGVPLNFHLSGCEAPLSSPLPHYLWLTNNLFLNVFGLFQVSFLSALLSFYVPICLEHSRELYLLIEVCLEKYLFVQRQQANQRKVCYYWPNF